MDFRIAATLIAACLIGSGTGNAQQCANRCSSYALINPVPDNYGSYYWNLTNNCPRAVRLCGCSIGNCESAGCYHLVNPGESKRVTTNRSARTGDTVLVYIAFDDEPKPMRGADHEAWMSRYDQRCGGLTSYNVR